MSQESDFPTAPALVRLWRSKAMRPVVVLFGLVGGLAVFSSNVKEIHDAIFGASDRVTVVVEEKPSAAANTNPTERAETAEHARSPGGSTPKAPPLQRSTPQASENIRPRQPAGGSLGASASALPNSTVLISLSPSHDFSAARTLR